MVNNYESYSIKIWLTSCFLPPLLFFLYIISMEGLGLSSFFAIIPFYFLACILTVVASIIPFLIFRFLNKHLYLKIIDPIQLKITINLQALFWGLLPFLFFLSEKSNLIFDDDILYLIILYAVIISGAVWQFKIVREQQIIKVNLQEDILDDDFNFEK